MPLTLDADGHAEVPPALSVCDPSDGKFVAVALADPATISIVNATDSDWIEIEDALNAAGVVMEHLLEPWLRAQVARR